MNTVIDGTLDLIDNLDQAFRKYELEIWLAVNAVVWPFFFVSAFMLYQIVAALLAV